MAGSGPWNSFNGEKSQFESSNILIQLMLSYTFVKLTENNYGQIYLCKQIRVGESRARREHLRKLAGNLRGKKKRRGGGVRKTVSFLTLTQSEGCRPLNFFFLRKRLRTLSITFVDY
jgi:hypothetical protein